MAIAVNEDGFREVLAAAEGMKEEKASWASFFQWLRSCGLDGVKLIVVGQMSGYAGGRGRSVPQSQVPAVYSSLLPQCSFGDASLQSETGG